MSVQSCYRETRTKLVLSFHNFPSYPHQQFWIIVHPFPEVFTLSLVPSDNVSYFNENITNFPKFPLSLNPASLSLSTGTYYNPVKFWTFHLYVRRKKKKAVTLREWVLAVILSAHEPAWQWQKWSDHSPITTSFKVKRKRPHQFSSNF